MFDVGFLELVVIMVLGLLVLGPERLPKAAQKAGYWFGKARRYVEGMKTQVEAEFDSSEVKRLLHNQEVQIRELQSKMTETGDEFNKQINTPFDDDDPGSSHQEAAETKRSEPQYDIIEDDDGGWGSDDDVSYNPEKQQKNDDTQPSKAEVLPDPSVDGEVSEKA